MAYPSLSGPSTTMQCRILMSFSKRVPVCFYYANDFSRQSRSLGNPSQNLPVNCGGRLVSAIFRQLFPIRFLMTFLCAVYTRMYWARLLSEDSAALTFEMAISRGEAWERAHLERQSVEVNKIGSSCLSKQPVSARMCHRCNSQQHMASSPMCLARAATCHHCGKMGIVCKSYLATTHTPLKPTQGTHQVQGNASRLSSQQAR